MIVCAAYLRVAELGEKRFQLVGMAVNVTDDVLRYGWTLSLVTCELGSEKDEADAGRLWGGCPAFG